MARILIILLLLPFIGYSQNTGSVIVTGQVSQATMQRGGYGADNALVLPVKDTTSGKEYLGTGTYSLRKQGRILVNTLDSNLYYFDGVKWRTAGGAVDSSIFATRYYTDSLYATIGSHDSLVKYTDTLTRIATQYGVDTAKANLRTSIATKIAYSDTTSLIPTKTFLLLNYYLNGGNSFGANSTIGLNDAFALDFETSGTTRMRLFANGRLGLNTTTDAGYLFDANGTGRFTGNLLVGAAGTTGSLIRSDAILFANNNSTMIKRNPDFSGVLAGLGIGAIEGGGAGNNIYFTASSGGWRVGMYATGTVFRDVAQTLRVDLVSFANAVVDISSNTRSFYMPRQSTINIGLQSGMAKGAMVIDTTLNYPAFYTGTNWRIIPKAIAAVTATLDFPSTSSNGQSDLTVTVTGAVLGDIVTLGIPNASVTNGTFSAWVSAADTVTVRFHNTSSVHDPASGSFKVMVIK